MPNQISETHPWKWYSPPSAKLLVIGTFPTARHNWSYDFFYPNKNNYFWQFLSKISDKELVNYEGEAAVIERKNILDNLNLAITDMGYEILRNDGSAADEKLEIRTYMDIKLILTENPGIEKLILTSSSGKVSALKWFSEYCKLNDIEFKYPKGNKPLLFECYINKRLINGSVLISPSPRPVRRLGFNELVEMYRNAILMI